MKDLEHRYRTIFEKAAVSIWEEDFSWCKSAIDNIVDVQGVTDFRQYLADNPQFIVEAVHSIKILDVNQKSLKLFGAGSKDELITSLNRIFVPETLAVFEEELIAIAEGSNYFESEAIVQTLQGEKINILITISFPEPSSSFDRVLVTLVDITERKREEEVLRVSEERFHTMADSAPVLIWIRGTDKVCTWFNRQWLEFVGHSMEQELGNGWIENIHPDDFENYLTALSRSFDTQEPFSMIYRLRRHDGEWRWVLDNGIPNYKTNKEFTGYIGSCIDITERKQAEENYRELFEKANDAIYVHELETGRILDVNQRATEITGFTKEEIINGNLTDFTVGTLGYTIDDALLHLHRAATEGRQLFEWQAKHKKGNLYWVEVSLYRATIAGANRILAFFHEIGDRKKAEEKLIVSEIEYRSLIEQATDGIFISNETGKFVDVNLSACKMLGYSKEELVNLSVNEILLQNEAKENPTRFDELLAGKAILTTRKLKKKDGSIIPAEINSKMMSNGRMIGIARDITERNAAQEKLERNEKLFRAMIEKNADMMILALPDGKLLYISPSLTNILGFTFDEYQSRPALDFIHPEDVPGLIEQMTGILDSPGKSFFRQHRLLHKDGTYRWYEGTVTNMLHDPDVGALVSNFRDITDRKKAEEQILQLNEELEQRVIERTAQLESNIQQLKESEEKFQKAFQASAAGVSITRLSDSSYLDVNDAFVEMTGYLKEELIGRTSTELGMVVNIERREEILQQIKEHGFAKHFEMTVQHKSGRILEVLSSVETIFLEGEKYAINIIFDITDRKNAEEQLKEVNKELEAFSYSVAHDLRSPLRIIDGYSGILLEDYNQNLDEEGQRLLSVIIGNTRHMGELIDDLLNFSRLGRLSLNRQLISVQNLINPIIEEQTALISERIEFKIGKLESINCDRSLMHHVFSNLISNAIKYSRNKEKPIIEIGSKNDGHEIIYFIKDNGVGFDMQYADKLFGVFQRLHKAAEFEGTGVGLAIVQRIISKHGGKIWVEAEVNKGATFYFCLPV